MGKTEKNILGKNAPVIIDLLKKAYCDEMQIFHYFWYIGINMEGIGLVTYAPALKTQATGELTHAELLSNRISELGDKAPSDPAVWKTQGNIGVLDPVQYLTLRAALEYNDFVTYNLATQILADEVKDEQHTEDVLKNLEVK
jgi:ferritin-like protein